MKEGVEVKRRWHKIRKYDSCFTGQDAVNVVLQYLQEDSGNFGCNVSRHNAVKLCQALMDYSVFEPICNTCSPKKFHDVGTKLYRFINIEEEDDDEKNHVYHPPEKLRSRMSTDLEFDGNNDDTCKPRTLRPNDRPLRCINEKSEERLQTIPAYQHSNYNVWLSKQTTQKHHSGISDTQMTADTYSNNNIVNLRVLNEREMGFLRKSIRRLTHPETHTDQNKKTMVKHSSLPTVLSNNTRYNLPVNVICDVWREVALLRLLLIVEIPILEGIMNDDIFSTESSSVPSDASSTVLRKHNSCSAVSSTGYVDLWTRAAVACLDNLDCMYLLPTETYSVNDSTNYKLKLFKLVSDGYSRQKEPLISGRMFDVFLVIFTSLLENNKESAAIEAIQLAVLLLPSHQREQLKYLMDFVCVVVRDKWTQLSKNFSNEELAIKELADAVIHNPVLSKKQAARYIGFMSTHAEAIFTVPPEVEAQVHRQLQKLAKGNDDAVLEMVYCEQITELEFEHQREDATETALVELMNSIIDDTNIPLKDKKQWLKKLQRCHPDVFSRNFCDML